MRQLTPTEREAMEAAMRDPVTGERRIERRGDFEAAWIAAREFYEAEGDAQWQSQNEFLLQTLDAFSESVEAA